MACCLSAYDTITNIENISEVLVDFFSAFLVKNLVHVEDVNRKVCVMLFKLLSPILLKKHVNKWGRTR